MFYDMYIYVWYKNFYEFGTPYVTVHNHKVTEEFTVIDQDFFQKWYDSRVSKSQVSLSV